MIRIRKWLLAAAAALALAAPLAPASAAKANEFGPVVPHSGKHAVQKDGPFFFWADAQDDAQFRQLQGFHAEIIVTAVFEGSIEGEFYVKYWMQ